MNAAANLAASPNSILPALRRQAVGARGGRVTIALAFAILLCAVFAAWPGCAAAQVADDEAVTGKPAAAPKDAKSPGRTVQSEQQHLKFSVSSATKTAGPSSHKVSRNAVTDSPRWEGGKLYWRACRLSANRIPPSGQQREGRLSPGRALKYCYGLPSVPLAASDQPCVAGRSCRLSRCCGPRGP